MNKDNVITWLNHLIRMCELKVKYSIAKGDEEIYEKYTMREFVIKEMIKDIENDEIEI